LSEKPEKFENRDLVLPGEILYEGRRKIGDNAHRHSGRVSASRIGLVDYGRNMVSVIALEAGFNPLVGDIVIGEILDIELGYWTVDIGTVSDAILNLHEVIDAPFNSRIVMPSILDVGDSIVAKIVDMDRRRTPILSIHGRDLGKLKEGFILKLTPSKIPRLIGKKGSMVNMIIKETGCRITIGQNGRIHISGDTREQEETVMRVIEKIEREAHISGLTNRIQDFFRNLKEEEL
jgi:exosome complex component RRP4